MTQFKNIFGLLLITLCITSCGPSAEEIAKRRKDEKAREDTVIGIYKKHLAGANEYMQKLKDLKSKLTIGEDSSVVFTGTMDPVLMDGRGEGGNVLLLSYGALEDSSDYASSHDDFGMYMSSDAYDAISKYKSLKEDGSIYASYYLDKKEVEKTASSLNTTVTPYVLIVRRLLTTPIKIIGRSSYSGGITLGGAWLADLRTMEVIGSTYFTALPGDLMTKENESDMMLQMKAKESSNREAKKIIKAWLKKFPGSKLD